MHDPMPQANDLLPRYVRVRGMLFRVELSCRLPDNLKIAGDGIHGFLIFQKGVDGLSPSIFQYPAHAVRISATSRSWSRLGISKIRLDEAPALGVNGAPGDHVGRMPQGFFDFARQAHKIQSYG